MTIRETYNLPAKACITKFVASLESEHKVKITSFRPGKSKETVIGNNNFKPCSMGTNVPKDGVQARLVCVSV